MDALSSLQEQVYEACRQVGIRPISTDTAARIMAILYVHGGGNEWFTHNVKFINDCKYIQQEYGIDGACVPDAHFVELVRIYVRELEDTYNRAEHDMIGVCEAQDDVPQWAKDLIHDRYNIEIK